MLSAVGFHKARKVIIKRGCSPLQKANSAWQTAVTVAGRKGGGWTRSGWGDWPLTASLPAFVLHRKVTLTFVNTLKKLTTPPSPHPDSSRC